MICSVIARHAARYVVCLHTAAGHWVLFLTFLGLVLDRHASRTLNVEASALGRWARRTRAFAIYQM